MKNMARRVLGRAQESVLNNLDKRCLGKKYLYKVVKIDGKEGICEF